jgi:8-oxo-dGTP diphosphatase
MKKESVGLIFYAADTHRQLFLLRDDRNIHTWGLPGGKVERGETLREAVERECREEIHFWTQDVKLFPLEQFTSDDRRFCYHTFFTMVPYEFKPVLNDEHIGYAWVSNNTYPKPLHRGLFNTLNYDVIQQKIAIIRESLK